MHSTPHLVSDTFPPSQVGPGGGATIYIYIYTYVYVTDDIYIYINEYMMWKMMINDHQ